MVLEGDDNIRRVYSEFYEQTGESEGVCGLKRCFFGDYQAEAVENDVKLSKNGSPMWQQPRSYPLSLEGANVSGAVGLSDQPLLSY